MNESCPLCPSCCDSLGVNCGWCASCDVWLRAVVAGYCFLNVEGRTMSDEIEAPLMSFDEMSKIRVKLSYERLGKLMQLSAPTPIIAKETAMLLDRLAMRYGKAVWDAIGEQAVERATAAMGFCPFHGGEWLDEPRLDARGSMCAGCWDEATETDERIEKMLGIGGGE